MADLELFRATRINTIALIKNLTLDQINKIPEGFTGNIAWHLGHMVSTHKGLVYQLNSAPGGLEKEFVLKYKKGSVPESDITQEEFEFITTELLNQVDELEEDLAKGDFFGDNIPYNTSYNFPLESFDSCLRFSNLHQGLHFGYMMAMKRSL